MEQGQQIHRDMGRLEGELSSLKAEFSAYKVETREAMADMSRMVSAMHDAMMQAKGGWRLMFIVGSAAGALVALGASFIGMSHK